MTFLHGTVYLLSAPSDLPLDIMHKTHTQYGIYSLLLPVWTVPNAVKATPCDMAAPKTSLHHADISVANAGSALQWFNR